jgi:hypothetical protein
MVVRWVRFYTRGLPAPVAERRIDEIRADLHDHIAFERERETSGGRISRDILSRMIRGIPADVLWRRRASSPKGRVMSSFVPYLIPALIGVAAIVFGESDDAPGLVLLGLLFVVGSLLFALRPSLRSRSRVLGFVVGAIALTVIGSSVAGWLENNF